MKNRIFLSAAILGIVIFLVNNIIGSTKISNNSKWIVPASIIDNDTIPLMNFPVIVIEGTKK